MVERGGGGVPVGTSSVASIHGAVRNQAYAASKAGLQAMLRTRSWRAGPTPMASSALRDVKFERDVGKRMPVRRWGDPADFGPLAVYLAARAGDGFHTGDSFVIDGGYSIF